MEDRKRSDLIYEVKSKLDLLKRYIKILRIIQNNGTTSMRDLSELTKYTLYEVRYSLRMLEKEGLIKPSPNGAVPTDAITKVIPQLKNKLKEMNKKINDIIDTLSFDK